MLPDARHAKTLVVVQGLTRQVVRYLHFSKAAALASDVRERGSRGRYRAMRRKARTRLKLYLD
jgi:hypothetical protein